MKIISKIIAILTVMTTIVSCTKDNDKKLTLWERLLSDYENDKGVTSLLFVKCTEGSCAAKVEYYVRNAESIMTPDRFSDARIGKNGPGKTREGDLKTPIGDFGVYTAFGIKSNPGTALPYIDVISTTYACDEDCEWYNRIIDTQKTGHACKGEHMSTVVPAYNYGMAIDYNKENKYPLGSAIFFHCKGTKGYTAGCVAVDEEFMKHILQTCGSSPKICIHLEGE